MDGFSVEVLQQGLEEARVLPVILSVIRARRAPVVEEITVTVVDRLTHTGSIVEYLVTYIPGQIPGQMLSILSHIIPGQTLSILSHIFSSVIKSI